MVNKYSRKKYYYLNRSTKTLKGEVWKEVKDFEGLYEVSNFGRIKALAKYREIEIPKRGNISFWTRELILKQSVKWFFNTFKKEPICCLTVALYKNGNYTTYTVPRLVYMHFGQEGFRLSKRSVILHKDHDGFNNHISNLYAEAYKYMNELTYRRKRKQSYFKGLNKAKRMSYAKKAARKNKKPVTQYDLKGRKVRRYPSITEAAATSGANKAAIANVVAGRYMTAGGFVWKHGIEKSSINVNRIRQKFDKNYQRRCKPVKQYTIADKRMVAIFPSLKAAAATIGGSAKQLSDAIHGRSASAYGFGWKLV